LATNELAVASHHNAPSHISFIIKDFFIQTKMTVIPTYPILLFLLLKIKFKGRHFDTIHVMEAESQAVLNTVTEHDFQDAFKKKHKRWERCISAKGDYSEDDAGQ
jgi:hypothetical protein